MRKKIQLALESLRANRNRIVRTKAQPGVESLEGKMLLSALPTPILISPPTHLSLNNNGPHTL